MTVYLNSKFNGATIVLDGNEYTGCIFTNCRVVVTRGNFVLKNSSFDGCVFEFGGEAENIRFLVESLLRQALEKAEVASKEAPAQPNPLDADSEGGDDG